MSGDVSNDNHVAPVTAREPEAYGQAAMLLVESLIHGLIERGILTVADAVEIVDVATELKVEIGEELGEPPATLSRSVQLLQAIGDSLRLDLSGK